MVVVLKWYLEFFNMILYIVILILGIMVVMEEENKDDFEFDVIVIDSIKIFLMGFFVGLGDFFFWGIL